MCEVLKKIGVLLGLLLLAQSCFGGEEPPGEFSYDPRLSEEVVPREPVKPAIPIPVDTKVTASDVRLSTKTAISPYLEAVGGPQPTPEELRLLPEEFRKNSLERYQLGAGIGIAVEERASLSLGYRFHQPLSLLDDKRQATPTVGEDLRIFFDVKFPFN